MPTAFRPTTTAMTTCLRRIAYLCYSLYSLRLPALVILENAGRIGSRQGYPTRAKQQDPSPIDRDRNESIRIYSNRELSLR